MGDKLKQTLEGLVELVTLQIKLARQELREDLRLLGAKFLRIAAFGPLLLMGYAFVMVAVALALAPSMGTPWAFLSVGIANLGIGVWGAMGAVRALTRVKVLDRSRDELEKSVERITAASSATMPAVQATEPPSAGPLSPTDPPSR